MYKHVIKPILFLFTPDFIHRVTIVSGRFLQTIPLFRNGLASRWAHRAPVLRQTLAGLSFENPVGLAAGFDKNVELTPLIESVGFGFETGGSVTLAPRIGNPRPWFYRLPSTRSLVVHAGMANKGLKLIEKNIRKNRKRLQRMPLMLSVAVVVKNSKETIDDAIIDAKNTTMYIIQHELAEAVEINISCPNVGAAMPFTEAKALEKLLTELDMVERTVPFFVKMPNIRSLDRFDQLLKIIARHNIQGLTIANLVKDRKHVTLKDPLPDTVRGGLSGVPTRERSLKLIAHAYRGYADRFVIIGVGGIFSAEDAYAKIRAGASLTALITGMIFEGPRLIGAINRGLERLLRRDGYDHITEAIGVDAKKY